jgi:hypothetical protein
VPFLKGLKFDRGGGGADDFLSKLKVGLKFDRWNGSGGFNLPGEIGFCRVAFAATERPLPSLVEELGRRIGNSSCRTLLATEL